MFNYPWRLVAVMIFAATLSGCVTTNTTPIAPDTFRLDTDASGLLFTGNAGSDTLLKAAEITQQRGYPYFKILDGASGAGSAAVGATATVYGNSVFAHPVYAPTQQVSVTVQMLYSQEQGAWSVADVIAHKGKMF